MQRTQYKMQTRKQTEAWSSIMLKSHNPHSFWQEWKSKPHKILEYVCRYALSLFWRKPKYGPNKKSTCLTSCAVLLNWHRKGLSGWRPKNVRLWICRWLSQTLVCRCIFDGWWHHMQSRPYKYSHVCNKTGISKTSEITLWVQSFFSLYIRLCIQEKERGEKEGIYPWGGWKFRENSALPVVFGVTRAAQKGQDLIQSWLIPNFKESWIFLIGTDRLWWRTQCSGSGLVHMENQPWALLEMLLFCSLFY